MGCAARWLGDLCAEALCWCWTEGVDVALVGVLFLILFLFVLFCLLYVVQVKTLNRRVCELMGFDKWVPVSGQTYSRKIDYQVSEIYGKER